MDHASKEEHAYFQRIGEANRLLNDERPPDSLQEVFDRLECIRRTQGVLAEAGVPDPDATGDLESHLAFLDHIRSVMKRRGSQRA